MFKSAFLIVMVVASSLSQALTDPTRPSSYASVATVQSALKLESILYANKRRVAVINGRALSVGDQLGDVKITAIGKQRVTLSRDGKSQVLRLKTGSIRQGN